MVGYRPAAGSGATGRRSLIRTRALWNACEKAFSIIVSVAFAVRCDEPAGGCVNYDNACSVTFPNFGVG